MLSKQEVYYLGGQRGLSKNYRRVLKKRIRDKVGMADADLGLLRQHYKKWMTPEEQEQVDIYIRDWNEFFKIIYGIREHRIGMYR